MSGASGAKTNGGRNERRCPRGNGKRLAGKKKSSLFFDTLNRWLDDRSLGGGPGRRDPPGPKPAGGGGGGDSGGGAPRRKDGERSWSWSRSGSTQDEEWSGQPGLEKGRGNKNWGFYDPYHGGLKEKNLLNFRRNN